MTELSRLKSLVPTAEELPALHQALAEGLSAELAERIGSILALLPEVMQLIEGNGCAVMSAARASPRPRRVCEGIEHPIRLVFTGRQHAGENLAEVLAKRQSGLPAPFHMGDGLSRNDPKEHQVVPCNCVVQARRNFVEIHGVFPDQCQEVVTSFAGIYRIEAQAKHLSPDQRQRLRQEHSHPVLDELKQ